MKDYDHAAVEGLIHCRVGADRAAEKAMIKQLTGTDEAVGRRCLSGLQVLIKQLRGAGQLADRG